MKCLGDLRVKVARLQFGTSKASAIALLMQIVSSFLGRVSSIHHGLELIRAVSIGTMVWWAYDSA